MAVCLLLSFVLPAAPVGAVGLETDVRGLAGQEEPEIPAGNWEGQVEGATAPLPAYMQAGEPATGEPVDLPVEIPLLPVLLEVTAERGVLAADETTALIVSVTPAAGAAALPIVVDVTLLLPEGLSTVDGQRSLTWSGLPMTHMATKSCIIT